MRLIDADALIDALGISDEDIVFEAILEDEPTVDAVQVVRCKDCRYYQDNNNGYPHNECRWRSDETPDADDFCSMAERKDDEIDRR